MLGIGVKRLGSSFVRAGTAVGFFLRLRVGIVARAVGQNIIIGLGFGLRREFSFGLRFGIVVEVDSKFGLNYFGSEVDFDLDYLGIRIDFNFNSD